MLNKTLGLAMFATAMVAAPAAMADGHSAGDPVKGEKIFKRCSSCHMVGPEAKAKVGPPLNDLFGRTAGTYEGFKYGDSIIEAGAAGLVWNDEEVFAYLKDPRKYLRAKLDNKKAKSKMAFKLKKDDQRADVIAYLKTFSKPAE